MILKVAFSVVLLICNIAGASKSFVSLQTDGSLGYLAPINSVLRLLSHVKIYNSILSDSSLVLEDTTSGLVLSLLDAISRGDKVDQELLNSLQKELFELYKHEVVMLNDPIKVFTAIRNLLDKYKYGLKFLLNTTEEWKPISEFPSQDSTRMKSLAVIELNGEIPERLYIIYTEPDSVIELKPSISTEHGDFKLTAAIVHCPDKTDAFACIIVDDFGDTFIHRSKESSGPFRSSFWSGKYIRQMYSVSLLVYTKDD